MWATKKGGWRVCIWLIVHEHMLYLYICVCVCVHMVTHNEEVQSPLGPSWGHCCQGHHKSCQQLLTNRSPVATNEGRKACNYCHALQVVYNGNKALKKGQSVFCQRQRKGTSPSAKNTVRGRRRNIWVKASTTWTLTCDNAGLSPAKKLTLSYQCLCNCPKHGEHPCDDDF